LGSLKQTIDALLKVRALTREMKPSDGVIH